MPTSSSVSQRHMIISMEVVGDDTLPPMKVMGILLCAFSQPKDFLSTVMAASKLASRTNC